MVNDSFTKLAAQMMTVLEVSAMMFVPSQYLRPGMILARDLIFSVSGNYTTLLLSKGQKLTNVFIDKINRYNITGVYIESTLTSDIEVKEVLKPPMRKAVLNDIQNLYEGFAARSMLSDDGLDNLYALSTNLVDEILGREDSMITLIDLKSYDDYTYHHCLSVAVLSVSTGATIGLNRNCLNDLAFSALLHDIGKMAIPIEIINKPSALTNEEYQIIKQHPQDAYTYLKNKHYLPGAVLGAIQSHHEKFDGSGYPAGKKGTQIPLYARILAVADVFDALTSNRPYRKQCYPNEVIEYMMGCADTHFDYEILTAFLKNIAAYPSGTCVALSNGETAIVVKNHPENILRPLVRLVLEDNTPGDEIDLLGDSRYHSVTIVGMGYDSASLDYDRLTK